MKNSLRTVVDTNTAVSACIVPLSMPREAIRRAIALGTLLVSDDSRFEMDKVFRRQKLDRYISQSDRLDYLSLILSSSENIVVTEVIDECRDPKDNIILELAVSGNADYIITGDADLLVLNPFKGIAIVTPAEFLTHIERLTSPIQ